MSIEFLTMTGEFVERRVRMKPEDVQGFDAAMRQFPQYTVIKEEEVKRDPEWDRELAELKGKIDEVKNAFDIKNSVCLKGFALLRQDVVRTAKIRGVERHITVDDMACAVIGLFDKSFVEHLKFSQRPISAPYRINRTETNIKYRTIPGILNPREIRLLIKGHRLSGQDTNLETPADNEGLREPEAALARANYHLANLYLENLRIVS